MEKIHGTNLGNWLVLEKWMKPDLFASTHTEDETWLSRKMPADEFEKLIRAHRDTYITEEDFRFIAENGTNTVRLPVPISPSATDRRLSAASNGSTRPSTGPRSTVSKSCSICTRCPTARTAMTTAA